jgi:hypothetical protein
MKFHTLTVGILLLHLNVANANSSAPVFLNGFDLKMSIKSAEGVISKHIADGYKAERLGFTSFGDRDSSGYLLPLNVASLKKGGYVQNRIVGADGPRDQTVLVTTGDDSDRAIFLITRRETWEIESAPHRSVFARDLAAKFAVPAAWINDSNASVESFITLRFIIPPTGGRQYDNIYQANCGNGRGSIDNFYWSDGLRPDGLPALDSVNGIRTPAGLKTKGNEPICSAYFQLTGTVINDKVVKYEATLINYDALYRRYFKRVVVPQSNKTHEEIINSPKAKF